MKRWRITSERVRSRGDVRADPSANDPRRDLSCSLESRGVCGAVFPDARSKESVDWNRRSRSARLWRRGRAEADDRLSIARIYGRTADGQRFEINAPDSLRSLEQARDVVSSPGQWWPQTNVCLLKLHSLGVINGGSLQPMR